MSTFDPNEFLEATFSEPSVKRAALPVAEYTAVVSEVKGGEWASKDGTKGGPTVEILLTLEVPLDVREVIKLDASTLKLTDKILLDSDPAKNINNGKIRAYREAVDLNKVGDTFKISALVGKPLKVKIKHEEYNGAIYEKVATVGKL